MTPQVAEPGQLDARSQPIPPQSMKVLGKHTPNLVLIWDSEQGKKPEFRVQLEIELEQDTARKVAENLWGLNTRTGVRLDEAKEMVIAAIPGLASPAFREIVKKAFEDQPQHKEQSD